MRTGEAVSPITGGADVDLVEPQAESRYGPFVEDRGEGKLGCDALGLSGTDGPVNEGLSGWSRVALHNQTLGCGGGDVGLRRSVAASLI